MLTGITGQLGVTMSSFLLKKKEDVIGVYRRTANPSFNRLEESGILNHPNLTLCSGDLTDYSSLDSIIHKHKPEYIINFGASSHVGESFETPIANLNITGGGCVNLLESVRNNLSDRYNPKIIQMSSSEMFGSNFSTSVSGFTEHYNLETDQGREILKKSPEKCWQDENTPLSANSPYSAAKIYAHNMCDLYRRAYKMYINSMICFNMEGEYRGVNFVTRKVTKYVAELSYFLSQWRDQIGLTVELCISNDRISILSTNTKHPRELDSFPTLRLGNLNSMRDWTYAEDACQAILLSLQNDKSDSYVVCSEVSRSISDLCKIAFEEIGIHKYEDFITIDPKFYRPVEVPFLRGSSKKIQQYGWKPITQFDKMISVMVRKDIERLK